MKDLMKLFFENYPTRSLDNEPHPFNSRTTADFTPLVKELFNDMKKETKTKFIFSKHRKESKYHK